MSSHDDRARRTADSLIINAARRDFRLSNVSAASVDDLEKQLKADPLFKQLEKYYATAPEDRSGNVPLGYYNKNMKPLMDALVKKYKTNQGVIGELATRGAGMSNVSAAGTTDTKYNSYDKKITAALSAAKASTTAARISLIALRKSDAEIPGEVNLEQCEKYIVAAMSNLMNAVRELGGGVGV